MNKGKEKSETQKRKNGTKKEERVRSTSLTRERERERMEVVEVTSTWSGLCGVRTNNFEGKERKGIGTGAKVERVKNFNAIQRQRRHSVEGKRETSEAKR